MATSNEQSALLGSDEEDVDRTLEQGAVAMRRRTLVGPWKYNEEFNKVFDWIYGAENNISTHELANSELDVWMSRRGYLCPAGITATKAILDAIVKDRKEIYPANDMKVFYSYAVTRFVNHMLSTQLNQNMRSMYDLAREMGLWSLVIDVRHVCSHELVLPELEMLREVSRYCLEWLKGHYWSPLKDTMLELKGKLKRTHDKVGPKLAINTLFSVYDTAFECILRGAKNVKESKRYLYKNKEKLTLINDFSKKIQSKDWRKILHAVVSELNGIGQREMLTDGFEVMNCEAFFSMTKFFSAAEINKAEQNLETIVDLTQGLFRYLANYGMLRRIFDHLVHIAEKNGQEDTICACASFWAKLILNGFVAYGKCQKMYQEELSKNSKLKPIDFSVINAGVLPNRIKKFLLYSSVDLERTIIFGNSKFHPKQFLFSHEYGSERLRNINSHTTPLLLGLLNLFDPELEEEKRLQLKSLMNVLAGKSLIAQTLEDGYVPKTVMDLYGPNNYGKDVKANKHGDCEGASSKNGDNDAADALIENNASSANGNVGVASASNRRSEGAFTACSEFNWSESALGRLPYE